MQSYDSMKAKLEATGLYEVSDKTNISAELTAYAAGLDEVFDALDVMEREMYIETAESYGLTLRERFFGRAHEDLSVSERREILTAQELKQLEGCTEEAFKNTVRGYGVTDFTFTENPTSNALTITINDSKTDAEKEMIEERIKLDFPAHLTVTVSYSS